VKVVPEQSLGASSVSYLEVKTRVGRSWVRDPIWML